MPLISAALAVLFVAAATLLVTILVDVGRSRVRQRRLRRVLEGGGLHATLLSGSAYRLEGSVAGAAVRIASRVSRPYPGKQTVPEVDDPSGTWLELVSAGPEVLVCRRDLTDLVLGPMPSLARHSTGDAAFDGHYEQFSTERGFDPRLFPPAGVRHALHRLGLQWLRRKDGRIEALFGDIAPNQMGALAAVAASLATATPDRVHSASYRDPNGAAGAPTEVPSAVDLRSERWFSTPLLVGTFFMMIAAVVGAAMLPRIDTARTELAELACEPGWQVVPTRTLQNDGTTTPSIGCRRAGHADRESSWSIYLGGGLVAAALVALLSLVYAAIRSIAMLLSPKR